MRQAPAGVVGISQPGMKKVAFSRPSAVTGRGGGWASRGAELVRAAGATQLTALDQRCPPMRPRAKASRAQHG